MRKVELLIENKHQLLRILKYNWRNSIMQNKPPPKEKKYVFLRHLIKHLIDYIWMYNSLEPLVILENGLLQAFSIYLAYILTPIIIRQLN